MTSMTGAGPGKLLRWYLSFGTFGIPMAAGPIAYALAALAATGNANDGAQIVLAMTVAQVIGAVPIARLGRGLNAVRYLRLLVGIELGRSPQSPCSSMSGHPSSG